MNLIQLHIISAFCSLMLLACRGIMQINHKNWRSIKLLAILPHISDTILLTTGIVLAFYVLNFQQISDIFWLVGKLACLVIYIFCSAKFFSRKTDKSNPLFFLLALLALVCAITLGYHY
ncbi:MAG: SirB2 family protein [Pasteurellaceae bacterium]|nr:SirB2 family protein [Pasteurellaceae bacterium]